MKLQTGDVFKFLNGQVVDPWGCPCLYTVSAVSASQVSFIQHTTCPKHIRFGDPHRWWSRPWFLEREVEVIDPFELWVEEVRREHGLVD